MRPSGRFFCMQKQNDASAIGGVIIVIFKYI